MSYVYIYFSPCHTKAFSKKQCISCVSCPAVSDFFDPMICNLPGSSVHGILQARILERVAILFSRRSFQPKCPKAVQDFL